MRPSGGSALDDDAVRLWTRALDVRLVVLVVNSVIALLVPPMAGHRAINALISLGVVLLYNLVLCIRIRRRRRLDAFTPAADLRLAVGYCALAPAAWPAVVAVAVADVALAVVM